LYPNAQINPDMGIVANPDTRHYLTKDIYTHVTSLPDRERAAELDTFRTEKVALKDTFYTARAYVVVEGIDTAITHPDYEPEPGDLAIGLRLKLRTLDGEEYTAVPVYLIRQNLPIP